VARLRGAATRIVRARVAPTTARQTPLEVIGYASGPDDPLPLDDRGVDRGIVARRAESSSDFAAAAGVGTRRGFCVLPR
jgi:hypothetical protein